MDVTEKPTIDTFLRLVAFYLTQNALPNLNAAIPGTTRMFDAIPESSHFRKVCALLHPDKNPGDQNIQSVLNSAFDLWRPILDDHELKNVTVHAHDDASTAAFIEQGEKYHVLSQMYFCYMLAMNNSMQILSPPTLSIWGLRKQLEIAEEEVELVKLSRATGGEVETLIEKALEVGCEQSSKKGGLDISGRSQLERNGSMKRTRSGGNTRKRVREDHAPVRGSSSSISSSLDDSGDPIDPAILPPKHSHK